MDRSIVLSGSGTQSSEASTDSDSPGIYPLLFYHRAIDHLGHMACSPLGRKPRRRPPPIRLQATAFLRNRLSSGQESVFLYGGLLQISVAITTAIKLYRPEGSCDCILPVQREISNGFLRNESDNPRPCERNKCRVNPKGQLRNIVRTLRISMWMLPQEM